MNTVELLSPAGDWDAMKAAVANGADAVYFGLSAFNARARAHNFTIDELPEVMGFLHARNVRGFVAMNVLIFPEELPEAERFTRAVAAAGVDAVIVQDLGLVRLMKRVAPGLPIHGSTQMTLTEPRGIDFVGSLGVERVVLARELSIADIRKVTAGTTMPVEVFVHGALCVAYSGQCLTSEALGGRSANRGQCAQACRLPYELIVDGVEKPLGDKAYLLSPQDLAAYDRIDQLIDAGVISFKIEGRLKGGPYVAATTALYRKAVDTALEGTKPSFTRKEELDTAQTFSRGLTTGFLDGVNHQYLVRGRFPKSRGVKLGIVVEHLRNGVAVKLTESLPADELVRAGDGVLFDLGRPDTQEPGGRIWAVDPGRAPGHVHLKFDAVTWDATRIPIGTDVWKTDDPALTKRLTQTWSRDELFHRLPLTMTLRGTLGGSLVLTAFCEGKSCEAAWPGPLETATKRATTEAELRDALSRLGETRFRLHDVSFDLPPEVMIPKSVLNDLRRKATAELATLLHASKVHATATAGIAEMRDAFATKRTPAATPELTVLVRSLAQLDAALAWVPPDGLPKPTRMLADFEDLRRYADAVPKARAAGVTLGLAVNRVWKPGEDGFQSLVVRANPDAVLVRNLASISYFKEQLPQAELWGDFSLNVSNELTAELLIDRGLTMLTPSYDLNWEQFQSLMTHGDPAWFEPVIHQHMPMFHMEHCVFAAFLSTGKDHRDCGRPCETHRVELRDRTGANFPVHPDTGCRNTVFNNAAQSAAEYVARMLDLGLRRFRIDALRETPTELHNLLTRYTLLLHGREQGSTTWRSLKVLHQLGVTRGTLNQS